MFRMSHLGPHAFVAEDMHQRHPHWIHDFTRDERHRMVEEDRSARWQIAGILVGVALLNVAMLTLVVFNF